jgi:glucosylceramidase
VLDETGISTADWHQCSPVVVDSRTKAVTYTPFYYCYKHFSHFVQVGARLVASESSWHDQVAFVNPDGGVVVVVANMSKTDQPVALNIDGRQSEVVALPAHSFSTFTLDGISN